MNDHLYSKITIIIVLYEEELNLVLKSIENIKNFKIVIIDNAGNKILKNQVEQKFKIHKYILNLENIGYSKAINQAINLCDSEYIFVSQADCVITEINIKLLLESHQKYKNCFLVVPTCYNSQSEISFNSGAFPEKKLENKAINLSGDICVDIIVTAAYLFKKKDMIDIGLFDENFFIYFLDYELCRRIKSINKSIIQIFNAKALHDHGSIKASNYIKKIFLRNYNFTFDELYYHYKADKHHIFFRTLQKKIPNYFIKLLLNTFLFRVSKITFYLSKILAFYKFKKFLKNN
jgi:N-acetylglucosaminyl-diphospho-decaprenol L-rhamnosyltransferase